MNLIESMVSSEFIRAFAWTLFHSLWQGGLLALIAAGLLVILRKHRPGIRYAILYILMLLIPLIFAGTFLMIYNPGNTDLYPGAQASGAIWQTENSLAGNLQSIPVTEIPRAWYAYLVNLFENHAKWLVMLWFAGFFIFLLRFSGSILYVYRLKNYQVYQVDKRWNANLRQLSDKIGIRKPVKLAESALARIPLTIGYLKPVILLPLGTLSGVPPQQIDAILLHELAHILRKDYLLNIIQSVIELLFFYHPVTWWLSGLIRQEREHICDDLAVAVNQDHINYIKALTTMEELNAKSPLLASAIMDSKKKLLCRVKRLLSPVKLRKGFSEGIIACVLLVGLILTLSLNALSVIPNAYDLSGRESGERVYSLIPFHNDEFSVTNTTVEMNGPEIENAIFAEKPDTLIAKSKSGKVTISVYTDSTGQLKQEQVERMAESMDRQTQQFDKARKEYQVQVEKFNDDKERLEEERKIVIIRKSDSTSSNGDSVIVIYNEISAPRPGHHFEYEFNQPDCPVPPHAYEFSHFYSNPDMPDLENLDKGVFSFKCDSIDTLIFMGPEGHLLFDNKDFELSAKEMQEHMKDLGIDMERQQRDKERQQRDIERFYRDQQGDLNHREPINPFYYSIPPVPPVDPQWNEHNPGPRYAPDERIIRQELIDDGLATPHKKYIIDLDSHGMYINGEKQSKDTYRKYKHLVESLEISDLKNDGIYRMIF